MFITIVPNIVRCIAIIYQVTYDTTRILLYAPRVHARGSRGFSPDG